MCKIKMLCCQFAMCALATCLCFSFTSCSSSSSDDAEEEQKDLGNGFRLTEVGMSYAMFEISLNDLNKLFWERTGTPQGTNVDLSAYGMKNEDFNKLLPDMFVIRLSETKDFSEQYVSASGTE